MAGIKEIDHLVVLMLENRSFDQMLGFLYPNKQGPRNQPFEGLKGDESTSIDHVPAGFRSFRRRGRAGGIDFYCMNCTALATAWSDAR